MGSKLYVCLGMISDLSTGRTWKIGELARRYEVSEHIIIECRKEIECLGFEINKISGANGGYRMDKSVLFPSLRLTDSEKRAVSESYNYLMKRNDFMEKDSFHKAIGKLFCALSHSDFEHEVAVINRYPLAMPEEEIQKRYDILKEGIDKSKVIKFSYISQKNVEKEYLFEPYELFVYNNAWFVIGWNRNRGDIAFFKINRITKIGITEEKFKIWKMYNRSNYLDEYGFKNNGDWYHVEFEAYNIYASLVKERIYGKNQKVIPIDEKTTLVKVDMQNKESILVFVLGFNRNLKVLEPQWLIEELNQYSHYLAETYKGGMK